MDRRTAASVRTSSRCTTRATATTTATRTGTGVRGYSRARARSDAEAARFVLAPAVRPDLVELAQELARHVAIVERHGAVVMSRVLKMQERVIVGDEEAVLAHPVVAVHAPELDEAHHATPEFDHAMRVLHEVSRIDEQDAHTRVAVREHEARDRVGE